MHERTLPQLSLPSFFQPALMCLSLCYNYKVFHFTNFVSYEEDCLASIIFMIGINLQS